MILPLTITFKIYESFYEKLPLGNFRVIHIGEINKWNLLPDQFNTDLQCWTDLKFVKIDDFLDCRMCGNACVLSNLHTFKLKIKKRPNIDLYCAICLDCYAPVKQTYDTMKYRVLHAMWLLPQLLGIRDIITLIMLILVQ